MATKSEQIRDLHAEGLSTSEIARKIGIRYQFAYGVLQKRLQLKKKSKKTVRVLREKPLLKASRLLEGGFVRVSQWALLGQNLRLESPLPKVPGVYAFAKDGIAQYVGVATTTLAKRCSFYIRPGITQRTSIRLNKILKEELARASIIEIYIATPSDCCWNGWALDGNAGLEAGIILHFKLPWNKRGANTPAPTA